MLFAVVYIYRKLIKQEIIIVPVTDRLSLAYHVKERTPGSSISQDYQTERIFSKCPITEINVLTPQKDAATAI